MTTPHDRMQPCTSIVTYVLGQLVGKSFNKVAAAQKPASGLRVTGVRPVDASVLTEYDFQAAKLEGAAPTTPTTNDRGLHGGEHPLQDADPG